MTDTKLNFTDQRSSSTNSASLNINLVKVHACLMLVAWVTCSNVGVFISRHFKLMWRSRSTSKKKLWFQLVMRRGGFVFRALSPQSHLRRVRVTLPSPVTCHPQHLKLHRGIMSVTFLLTLVGFVIIFVAKMGYSSGAGAHPVLGILVTALVIINPIMAACRPPPDAMKRPLFNWFHWFVGSLARVFAVAAILLGLNLDVIDLPHWLTWLFVGFVGLHLCTQMLLEVVSVQYGHISNLISSKHETIEVDRDPLISLAVPGEGLKNTILTLYSILNLAIAATLISFIAIN